MNKNINNKLSVIPIIFFALILLSGCSGLEPTLVIVTKVKTATQERPILTETSILPTVTKTLESTPTVQVSPTRTKPATITPTKAPTGTATKSPTPITPTSTNTPEAASLTLKQDTACFAGTSFGHELLAYVSVGMSYPILATIENQSWWFVDLSEEDNCWIYGEYAEANGIGYTVPVITPSPPPTPLTTLPPTTNGIYYILILKDTGGPFGCGDSLIRYYPGVWVNGDMEEDILAALNALFANHSEYVNGLYNPIYQSQLKAKGVEMSGGEVIVQLGGSLVKPKDNCESQRMHDQIWYTISQFTSTRPIVYLNNALLGDLLVVMK